MLIEIAVKLLIPIVIGFFVGLQIDKLVSTTPLIAIIMALLGMLAGIYLVYKQYNR